MVWFMALVFTGMAGGMSAHGTLASPRLVAAAPAETAAALLASDARHIRAVDRRAARLLAEGVRRSPTFAGLVAAIHGTDVIVYLQTTDDLPPTLGGRLMLQAVTPHQRYVRVQVRASLRPNQGIEVAAHELRHVLEVADDRSVVNEAGLVALYRRIGYPSPVERGFESDAARRTGAAVREELQG